MPAYLSAAPSKPVRAEASGYVLPPFVHDYLAGGAGEGSRNDTLHKTAQQFLAARLPLSEAEARLLPRALADGLGAAEARQAIASAYKSTKVVEPLQGGWENDEGGRMKTPAKVLGFLDALQAAFFPGETVAVVESRQNEDGDWKPSVATMKTLEGWAKWCEKMGGDINRLFGATPGGAFIGINPYRAGADRRSNDNVAAFRHVLAEWDDLPAAQQHERLVTSGLPISVIVTSGGKSVHGWVRVDATTKAEWDRRRDAVHQLLGCDTKNKDIARVSRCPGAVRGDSEQKVLAVRVGAKSWAEYEQKNEWVPVSWGVLDLVERGPEPPPEVICGVLRRSCHLQISSGAKMRKSYALIDLALSVATGKPWLGLETVAGPVFYADAENQAALIRQRIPSIAAARGITLDAALNERLRFAPLRGLLRGKSLPEVVAGVTRSIQAMREPPVLAILEPLYLLLRGAKENEAEEVTAALEELDGVCTSVGCAIAYVHHFSKGNQALKKSMDRSSGSGALSRYPDAIMTLNPPPEEPLKKGEAKPDYDAMVELTTRWFPPRLPFPVWWKDGHYEPETRKIGIAKTHKPDSTAGKYGPLVKVMPRLRRHSDPTQCAVCSWLAHACKVNLTEAANIFGTLRSGIYSGLFIVSLDDGEWQGVEWDEGEPEYEPPEDDSIPY